MLLFIYSSVRNRTRLYQITDSDVKVVASILQYFSCGSVGDNGVCNGGGENLGELVKLGI